MYGTVSTTVGWQYHLAIFFSKQRSIEVKVVNTLNVLSNNFLALCLHQEQLSDKDHELRKLQVRQTSEIDGMHEEATRQIKELQLQVLKKENEASEMRQDISRKEDELRQTLQGKTKQELELEQVSRTRSNPVSELVWLDS